MNRLLRFTLTFSFMAAGLPVTVQAYKPLGKPGAPKGGDFTFRRPAEPASLNPIVAEGHSAADLESRVFEPLLISDPDTYEWTPNLADHYRILSDQRTYEFHIRRGAVFSDGRPVTAADVKFSFDVLFNPAFPTAHMRPYYEGIERVEIVNSHTVRFHARNSYFGNFISSAGLPVVPRHVYADPKVGPHLHDSMLGSGPYVMEQWQRGVRLIMRRNPLWWGWRDPLYRNSFNPDRLIWRFVGNESIALEMLKRGEIDYMDLSANAFVKLTSTPAWGAHAFKAKVSNNYPKSWQFIAWNMDRPLFADRRVRKAMDLLVDRRILVEKLSYGMAVPATGPWYRQSPFADTSLPEPEFNPAKALRQLRAAGWEDGDGDGILEKDGRKLTFTIATPSLSAQRYLTVFQEDAKKAGVDIHLKMVDSSLWSSFLDRRAYDAVQFDWGSWLVDLDPKPMWHSTSVGPGGQNFSGYRSAEVDRMIEQARHTPDRAARRPLMRALYRRIADDAPALFVLNDQYQFYAYSKRVGRPTDSYGYDVGTKYWWVQPAGESLAQVHR